MKKDYHINIFYSEDDEGYIADIPDLPSCSAFAKSPEKALQQALIAKKAWLESAKKMKIKTPLPRYRPLIYQLAEQP
jgi:predicted RNase H-like HicB family nuclease